MTKIKSIYKELMKDALYLTIIGFLSLIFTVCFAFHICVCYLILSSVIFIVSLYKLLVLYVEPYQFEFASIRIGLKSSANYYFVDSSRSLYFFIPRLMETKIPNKSIQNIAAYSQPFYHSYIIMKKLLKKPKTELIFYDITMLNQYREFGTTGEDATATREIYDRFLPHLTYMERILYCLHYGFPLTFKTLLSLFSLYRFRHGLDFSRKKLRRLYFKEYNDNNIQRDRSFMYDKGYRICNKIDRSTLVNGKVVNIDVNNTPQIKLPTEYVVMLKNLLKLAKKRNKKIYFIISPLCTIPKKDQMDRFYYCYDHLARISEQYGSKIIDMNKNIEDTDFDTSCFIDSIHVNHKGAQLSSELFINLLKNM